MKYKLLAIIWFYVAWFACVYCGHCGWGMAALPLPFTSFVILNRFRPLDLMFVFRLFSIAIVGVLFDYLAFQMEWISFPKDNGPFPFWLFSMWFLFVAILPLTEFLQGRWALAALLAAVMGPLSYYSGNAFGVLVMNGTVAFIAYATFWAVFFPLSLKFQKGSL